MNRRSILLLPLLVIIASAAQAQTSHAAKEYVKRGIARFSRGDIDGAISSYEKAMQISPQLADAFFHRGKARRAKGDLDGAIADYESSIELEPRLAENNADIANAYYNRGFIRTNSLELNQALLDFDRAIACNPKYAEAFLKRGEAHLILGELTLAISDFGRTLELKPRPSLTSLAFAGRGFAELLKGDDQAAERDFDESVKLNSEGKFFLELHLRLLEAQIKEVNRRRRKTLEPVA